MNRKIQNSLGIAILALALLLAGCAGSTRAANNQQPETTPAGRQPGEMSTAMKLALGTLKLKDTQNSLSAEQAKTLLPLWKGVRSLSNSSNAASQEIQGLFAQIEKTLTPNQVSAIDAMQLKMEDMQAIAKELGIELGGPNADNPTMQATMQAARATAQASGETLGQGGQGGMGGPPGGGMPIGGGPGMGGLGMDSSGLTDDAKATAMAKSGGRGAQVGLPAALIDAVIKALEELASS